ncbi:MDR family MFS transporter [Virgibacillus sp. 179-BFC.A HS]|uniref:MDR family MFS transporter n=1 Tax=Tigheibacillus jepli TaxID=3035914 RepID=A0ABU5CEZ7_9BACI|nr:MDR family MFS transporter [Virgibacillus sp. 179-BFC.A HS]MDY0404866.1 MDR family MFS transporter [Virgibacillus sp. 179-BFC.A HS]
MNKSFQHAAEGMIVKKKRTRRPLVLASLIIAMFMSAIEGTIVATAMPNIVGDLGGFSLYSWVFSAFLLMTAVTTLIYGKLADLFGRKPIFIFGVVVFLVGSLLCGFSKSMVMLVFSRFIQGIGAGAVQPISQTIVGDMYTVEERAKIQGYLASVWGISAVLGPLVGGLIVQYSDWAWIFWMNVPLGILGMIGIVLFLHEDIEKTDHSIDYAGSALIIISITSLMVVLIQGGVAWSWLSWPVIGLLALFVASLVIFLWHENRAASPMMPLHLWKNRLIALANVATLTSGMIMIGLSSFLPTFVQGVMGYSAIVAGFTLTMMSVGWPIASSFAGHIFLKIGYRATAILGGFALFIGGLFFIFLSADKGPVWAGAGSFFTGIGMGLTATTFIVSIQNSVGWKTRGIATASNMFMRMLGSALGAAILGGILNTRMKDYLSDKGASLGQNITVNNANELLAGNSHLPAKAMHLLENALSHALHSVYEAVFIFAVVTLVLTIFLPKPQRKSGYNRKN